MNKIYLQEDSGKTERALKGDIITIELAENPTTGYSWNLTASSGLSLKTDQYKQTAENEMRMGAGGVHTWTFEVTGEESQLIEAVYKRPWEDTTGNEESFTLSIEVIPETELIHAKGTVTFVELEGGFYGIISDETTSYDPINLDDTLMEDGLELEFTAYPRDDLMSFHMWGRLIEIRSVEIIN
ncbi:protease inhibitor I42 family protein [Methanolobus sp. ZRKC3]|uniref:protease inhibitor I42 family protein n=1 Tax=Methanolobus sp. ZRKC3 TaxID=3125786 RepID=UPI0032464ED0